MNESQIQALSDGALKNNLRSRKLFVGVFLVLIAALFYFPISDYLNGKEVDWATLTIAICTIGGLVTIWPEYAAFRKEVKRRGL